ncbi:hypothetical protein IWW36_001864 [Coemansia brasiliensis]|uniref:Lipoyl-binding domain-containing protein n=1 Tax=Coemansia brasiliensis TaxID=2650707 RepID=A0A9W8I8C3_9FUNG|nr:hypothetical protein IWW36_001864 [Coemansia brasiliensis]
MLVSELFSVKNKVVLVTGGGSGIGLMISRGFVRNGAKVYIASRKGKVLEKAAQELTQEGPGECIALPCDLQDYSQVRQLSDKLYSSEPDGIDVLVNNSGATWGSPSIEEYPDSAFTKVLTLNVQRVFTLTQLLVPLLEKRGQREPARVINVGSIDGISVPALVTPAYAASKAAVHHLTRVLGSLLGPRNITCNAVAPGPFESHMMKATLEMFHDVIVERIPLRRIGRPQDIAGICIYLASSAGAYINGAVIPVDGGALSILRANCMRLRAPLLRMSRRTLTKYTESHEWVKIDNDVATIGITDYAQNALGDVVYVEVPEVDNEVEVDEVVGIVESVKSTSDIYTPLSGTIVDANKSVVENTKLVNKSPESDGWLFKIKFSSKDELDKLMDATQYKKLIEEGH